MSSSLIHPSLLARKNTARKIVLKDTKIGIIQAFEKHTERNSVPWDMLLGSKRGK